MQCRGFGRLDCIPWARGFGATSPPAVVNVVLTLISTSLCYDLAGRRSARTAVWVNSIFLLFCQSGSVAALGQSCARTHI